ncbi:MAG: hypothetical protein ACR5LD_07615 [Symbiopectobacterium sp.]
MSINLRSAMICNVARCWAARFHLTTYTRITRVNRPLHVYIEGMGALGEIATGYREIPRRDVRWSWH